MALGQESPFQDIQILEDNGCSEFENIPLLSEEQATALLLSSKIPPSFDGDTPLKFGIFCFNQFLQSNWTGPNLEKPAFSIVDESQEMISDALSIDGEQVYTDCRHKELLLAAIRIFDHLAESSLTTIGIWRSRAYFVWQRVISDANDRGQGHCPSLMQVCLYEYCISLSREGYISTELGQEIISHLSKPIGETRRISLPPADSVLQNLRAELIIELIVRLCYYNRLQSVSSLIRVVSDLLSIEIDITGVEGIRRQHQTVSFAQLAARVKRIGGDHSISSEQVVMVPTIAIPRALNLVDYDVTTDVYESVQIDDTVDNQDELDSRLSAIEECLIIAIGLKFYYSGNVRDELNLESVHALAMRIISTKNPSSWITFSMALLLRSRSEFFRNTTRGRACFQVDALVDQFSDNSPNASIRLRHIHSTGYPSLWELQRENGLRMMEVGMVVTACEMFKKLKMWPLAMDCLAVSGRKSEAIELLDSLEPLNPRLLCSKGDMTGNIDYYQQAWEKSGHTNARSQRSIGRMKLKNQDLHGAAIAFESSLEINPLFDDIWYSLGCIYLKLEESDKAIRSFLRCVSVNPEHVQAWVNLSAVYSSPDFGLEFIQEAKNAASEAVKISSQAWQFWENFVLISAKAQDWQNVIQGERRLSLTLDRPDHPDISMIRLLHANVTDKNTRIRLISFLEDLVLRNKQTFEILKILSVMYVEFYRYEESFKTQTALLKELLSLMQDIESTTRKTGKTCQNIIDEIFICLQDILNLLGQKELDKIPGLTTGLGLTVRSIPRRIAAINGGMELPNLKNLCDTIQNMVKNRDRLLE